MSKETTVLESSVKKAYSVADKATKIVLKELFNGKVSLSDKITDRIKTFEDACAELGINKPNFLFNITNDGKGFTNSDVLAFDALSQLTLIVRALNEGWTPDWRDSNQSKYYVWLTDYKPGSGFSRSFCDNSITVATVGSRLCFKSSELAEYAGEQFRDLYNQYFNL